MLLLLAAIWGTSFILMKKSLELYSSIQVASIRISSAFLFFLPILIAQWRSFPIKKLPYMAMAGVLGMMGPAFLFSFAGKYLPSALSGALNALTPLFTLIVGAVFFKNSIKNRQIIGIILGIIGSLFLVLSGKLQNLTINVYAFLVVAATIMYAFNLQITKRYLNDLPALQVTAGLVACIGIPSLALLFSTDFWPKTLVSNNYMPLFYTVILGVVGTALATILFNKLLQKTQPVFASSVTYLIPIFAFMWGIADGEKLGLQHALGMAIVLIGVYLVNSQTKTK
jgi:drug/metabolite transporter (DMT)-like permease